jgi:hypothetical protein
MTDDRRLRDVQALWQDQPAEGRVISLDELRTDRGGSPARLPQEPAGICRGAMVAVVCGYLA